MGYKDTTIVRTTSSLTNKVHNKIRVCKPQGPRSGREFQLWPIHETELPSGFIENLGTDQSITVYGCTDVVVLRHQFG